MQKQVELQRQEKSSRTMSFTDCQHRRFFAVVEASNVLQASFRIHNIHSKNIQATSAGGVIGSREPQVYNMFILHS